MVLFETIGILDLSSELRSGTSTATMARREKLAVSGYFWARRTFSVEVPHGSARTAALTGTHSAKHETL